MKIETYLNVQNVEASDKNITSTKSLSETNLNVNENININSDTKTNTSTNKEILFSDKKIDDGIKKINEKLIVNDEYIQRTVHEKTKAIIYHLKNIKTDEVIWEFPPEKLQDMVAKMMELSGVYVDKKI